MVSTAVRDVNAPIGISQTETFPRGGRLTTNTPPTPAAGRRAGWGSKPGRGLTKVTERVTAEPGPAPKPGSKGQCHTGPNGRSCGGRHELSVLTTAVYLSL